jgi:GDP-4-dehydro-6-deoxy-D-mannose reductase
MSSTAGTILVTGANGFVGKHLVPMLRATWADMSVESSRADVTDRNAVNAEIRQIRPVSCVHLAAIATVAAGRDDPDAVWRVNLGGTLNLARAILAEAPSCHFLFVSTADAYGKSFTSGLPIDETSPLAPLNTYAASKAAADLAVGAMAADGLRAIRLRPFNHTGPGQTDSLVVASFARQAARIAAGLQPPILQVGDLTPQRDFLDVRDVCAAYVACLKRADDIPPGSIFNIASGQPRRIGDVLTDLLALTGVAVKVEPDPERMRPSDIPFACGDASRAQEVLGWTPKIAWQQTLADVLQDWRDRLK